MTLKRWDTGSGLDLLTLRGHAAAIDSVVWSPDGERLATGSFDNTAQIWDAASGKSLLVLHGHTGAVDTVAWSPDGKHVATASFDGTVRGWDTHSGRELLAFRGSPSFYAVVFSPDGKRLAAGSFGGIIQIFLLDIRELLALAHKRISRKPPDLTPDECLRYFQSKTCPSLPQ